MSRRQPEIVNVIKIGGGLAALPGALGRVCREVGLAARDHTIVVVPGGGPFADAVRQFDRTFRLSGRTAHWMAVLAMDQYAYVLAERIPAAVIVDQPGAMLNNLKPGVAAVLAPSRWMRAADVLPHSWEATSDSIAAFVAGAIDAARLILIKPGTGLADPVDPYFATALPHGMPCSILGCERLEELPVILSG